MIVFPGFGETWDNNPYTTPRISADQAMKMTKALVGFFSSRGRRFSSAYVFFSSTSVFVQELVKHRTRDEWHWEWTPATVVVRFILQACLR